MGFASLTLANFAHIVTVITSNTTFLLIGAACDGIVEGGTFCNESEQNCEHECGGNWCSISTTVELEDYGEEPESLPEEYYMDYMDEDLDDDYYLNDPEIPEEDVNYYGDMEGYEEYMSSMDAMDTMDTMGSIKEGEYYEDIPDNSTMEEHEYLYPEELGDYYEGNTDSSSMEDYEEYVTALMKGNYEEPPEEVGSESSPEMTGYYDYGINEDMPTDATIDNYEEYMTSIMGGDYKESAGEPLDMYDEDGSN